MRSIKNKVEAILREYPNTRNSDHLLLATYWQMFDRELIANNEAGDWIHISKVPELTSPESIRRYRQIIQGEGKYLATDTVIKGRRKKASQIAAQVFYGESEALS